MTVYHSQCLSPCYDALYPKPNILYSKEAQQLITVKNTHIQFGDSPSPSVTHCDYGRVEVDHSVAALLLLSLTVIVLEVMVAEVMLIKSVLGMLVVGCGSGGNPPLLGLLLLLLLLLLIPWTVLGPCSMRPVLRRPCVA